MAKKQPKKLEEITAPAWMTTFGDMTTLILTFFVLLITMMVIDPKKYVEVLGVFRNMTGEGSNIETIVEPVPNQSYFVQIIRASTRRATRLDGGEVPAATGETVTVFAFKENYVVKVADKPFFNALEVTLTTHAKERIQNMARQALQGGSNRIKLIGHYAPDEVTAFRNAAKADANGVYGIARRFEWADPVKARTQTAVWLNDPQDLASYRARAVKEFLIMNGIAAERIETSAGEMISGAKTGSTQGATFRSDGKGYEKTGDVPVDVSAGTAEASDIGGQIVDGMKVMKGPVYNTKDGLRTFPNFIFTEGGNDRGRTVEIVVTGEIVGSGESFVAPLGK